MRVRLTPEADADLTQVFAWYAERGSELGEDFFSCFEAVVRKVENFPELAPVVHPPFRRALLRRLLLPRSK